MNNSKKWDWRFSENVGLPPCWYTGGYARGPNRLSSEATEWPNYSRGNAPWSMAWQRCYNAWAKAKQIDRIADGDVQLSHLRIPASFKPIRHW